MSNSKITKLGSACVHFALSASSIAMAGTANSYYSSSKNKYGNNTRFLIENGIMPLSARSLFKNNELHGLNKSYDNFSEYNKDEFHFTRGKIVRELILVDAAVQDKSIFFKLENPYTAVIEIPRQRGTMGLFSILSRFKNLDAVHLVSHGKAGALEISGELLTRQRLQNNIEAFTVMNKSIKPGGDLLLYGCETAKGKEGEDFLEILKDNTHIDIAASNNNTGNPEYSADWDLEIHKGSIEAKPLPESIALYDFTGILQFTGTIYFDQIKDAGDYQGDSTVDAEFYTSSSKENILVADGTSGGTGAYYAPAVLEYGVQSFDGESKLRLNFSNNGTFDVPGISSIYIMNYSGGSRKFYFNSNSGYMGYQTLANNTGSYIDLASNNNGISYVDITADNNFYAHVSLFRVANVTLLPVELTSFTALLKDNSVELNWKTATEVNNYGFEIERLKDSKIEKLQDWEKIGFVKGNGNRNSPTEYSFSDNLSNLVILSTD